MTARRQVSFFATITLLTACLGLLAEIAFAGECKLNLSASNAMILSGGRLVSSSSGAGSGDLNAHLAREIEKNLNHKMPLEFQGCKGNRTLVWYEFLRGLAKIESDGKCSTSGDHGHFGGKGSHGIFQMTNGDYCGAGKKLNDPKNGEENITCATRVWAQASFTKIKGNAYWGPCKRWESKCQHIVNTVKDRVCNSSSAAPIDWHQVFATQGGSNQGYSSGGTQ